MSPDAGISSLLICSQSDLIHAVTTRVVHHDGHPPAHAQDAADADADAQTTLAIVKRGHLESFPLAPQGRNVLDEGARRILEWLSLRESLDAVH